MKRIPDSKNWNSFQKKPESEKKPDNSDQTDTTEFIRIIRPQRNIPVSNGYFGLNDSKKCVFLKYHSCSLLELIICTAIVFCWSPKTRISVWKFLRNFLFTWNAAETITWLMQSMTFKMAERILIKVKSYVIGFSKQHKFINYFLINKDDRKTLVVMGPLPHCLKWCRKIQNDW